VDLSSIAPWSQAGPGHRDADRQGEPRVLCVAAQDPAHLQPRAPLAPRPRALSSPD